MVTYKKKPNLKKILAYHLFEKFAFRVQTAFRNDHFGNSRRIHLCLNVFCHCYIFEIETNPLFAPPPSKKRLNKYTCMSKSYTNFLATCMDIQTIQPTLRSFPKDLQMADENWSKPSICFFFLDLLKSIKYNRLCHNLFILINRLSIVHRADICCVSLV